MSEIQWKTQRSWWAYIPEVFDEGVVVDAYTLDEAVELASVALLNAAWSDHGAVRYPDVERDGFFIYELGTLYQCNFNVEDEEE